MSTSSPLVSGGITDAGSIFGVCARGHIEKCREMLTEAPELVREHDPSGFTALHWAALHNRLSVVKLLLERGAPVDGGGTTTESGEHEHEEDGHDGEGTGGGELRRDTTGQDPLSTPLHWACQASHTHVSIILVEHGADIHRRDGQGYEAIHYASQGTKAALVHYLIGHGADVNARDNNLRTPLHWAAYQDRAEIVMYVLRNGADRNAVDDKGFTPLHWAAQRGNIMSTKLLVEHRCNATLKDQKGSSARELARLYNQEEVFYYLYDLETRGYHFVVPHLTGRPLRLLLVCCLPFLVEVLPFIVWFNSDSWLLSILVNAMALGLWSMTVEHHMPRKETPELGPLHIIVHFFNLGFWYFGLKAALCDPGYFRGPTISANNLKEQFEQGMSEEMFCPSCLHWRPYRSKHCRTCDKCVGRFDHHCPWVHNCVALNNQIYFIMFLISAICAHILFIPMAWAALFPEGVVRPWESPLACAMYLYTEQPWLSTVLFTSTLHGTWEFLLLGDQVYCAFINVTLNERINMRRYRYMHDSEGRPFNHYDRGALENVREVVFGSPYVDYTKPHPLPNTRRRYSAHNV
eukprot:TRINITY_DN762_c1_g1_i4.p1 TRINITY_DN762_c1_g1~~TRINITY_DN762_c1_g1_i4.p1  ORF type:complete len:595 (+),score=44.96 TRINITY_DN762_c1_g1_i4:56-1786(+)